MNQIQFDKLLKPLISIYDEIELDLIQNILNRLENYNNVQGSLEWYLEKLIEQNILSKENLKVFKKNKNKIQEVLENIVKDGAKQKDYSKILETLQEKGLLTTDRLDLYNSPSINRLIKDAFNDCEDIIDLINSKALEKTNETYKRIINKAYVETASGVYSYQESIRRGLKEMAKEGISIVNYESGKKLGIEAVVRRDVVTRVNKLVGNTTLENAKSLKTNLVYVDAHLGARIRTKYMKNDYEAHAEWQGEVYKFDEYNEELYPYGSNENKKDFFETTGFGEMLGLKGINCYHDFRPFFYWEKKPEIKFDEKENEDKYLLLQQQRAYERKIRRLKREKLVNKDFNKEEFNKVNKELNKTNKEFERFLDRNDLNRDYSREYVTNK